MRVHAQPVRRTSNERTSKQTGKVTRLSLLSSACCLARGPKRWWSGSTHAWTRTASTPDRRDCTLQVFVSHKWRFVYVRQPKSSSSTVIYELKHMCARPGHCTESELLHTSNVSDYEWATYFVCASPLDCFGHKRLLCDCCPANDTNVAGRRCCTDVANMYSVQSIMLLHASRT